LLTYLNSENPLKLLIIIIIPQKQTCTPLKLLITLIIPQNADF